MRRIGGEEEKRRWEEGEKPGADGLGGEGFVLTSNITPLTSLLPGERLDALGRDGLKIIQNPSLFRFTTDAYLLAAFARPRRGGTVLELGSGSGVVLLLLAARTNASHLVGLEIQPALAEMARRNVALNGLDDRVQVLAHDFRADCGLDPPRFGLVVSNPPYIPAGGGVRGASGPIAEAKHELTCTLRDVVQAAARWRAERGRFVLVHQPRRLPEIFAELEAVRLVPKRMALVHARPGRPASMVLVEARDGARPGLTVLAPVYVRDAEGGFTGEMGEIFAGRWPGT